MKLFRSAMVVAGWLLATSSMAYAHGGMAGPDELGPPVITSTILGLACYWAIVLWPPRRKNSENGKKPARRPR